MMQKLLVPLSPGVLEASVGEDEDAKSFVFAYELSVEKKKRLGFWVVVEKMRGLGG